MKIVLSCFLVNVAPGNLKLEVTRKTAASEEEEEGGKMTVELDDNQVLSDLLESQCKTRSMKVTVRKNRENDLWNSYKLHGKQAHCSLVKYDHYMVVPQVRILASLR
jgi:hypothetical protein